MAVRRRDCWARGRTPRTCVARYLAAESADVSVEEGADATGLQGLHEAFQRITISDRALVGRLHATLDQLHGREHAGDRDARQRPAQKLGRKGHILWPGVGAVDQPSRKTV